MTMFILSVIWATSCLSLRISRSRSSSLAMKVCSAADGDIVFTDDVSLTLSRSSSIFRQHACAASKSVLKVNNIYLCDCIKSPVLGSKFLCFGEMCLELVQFVCLKFWVEYIWRLEVAKLPHRARIILYWTTWCHVTLLQKNKFETKVQTCAQILNDVRFHSHSRAVDDYWVFGVLRHGLRVDAALRWLSTLGGLLLHRDGAHNKVILEFKIEFFHLISKKVKYSRQILRINGKTDVISWERTLCLLTWA